MLEEFSKKKVYLSAISFIALVAVYAFIFFQKKNTNTIHYQQNIDLQQIKERGYLKAITEINAISYFDYRGQFIGYDYELAKQLAKQLGVNLQMVVAKNHDEAIQMLAEGKGDIIVNGFSEIMDKQLLLTNPYRKTEQVIVQTNDAKIINSADSSFSNHIKIDNITELNNKIIYIRNNSDYYHNIKSIADTLGLQLDLRLITDDRSTEDLIRAVANNEIEFTIANKDLALINQSYYNNLNIDLTLGKAKDLSFVVRKSSPALLVAVNDWLAKFMNSPTQKEIYNKYFNTNKNNLEYLNTKDLAANQISAYDDIIKAYANAIQWDWRLVAALIYQESKFNPYAKSWAGAKGLMQLMPKTAQSMGLSGNAYEAESNIRAGTKYLQTLKAMWQNIPDFTQRIKFILASYNAGPGHVKDAARLAKKYGFDETKWDGNVEYFILYKSNPKFYNDAVVQYGYCRGTETFNYVKNIIKKYFYYSNNYTDTIANFNLEDINNIPFKGIDGVYDPTTGLQLNSTRQEIFISEKLFESQKDLIPKNPKDNPFNQPKKELFKKNELKSKEKLFENKQELFTKDSSSSGSLIPKNNGQINQLEER
ncbi:MAG: transporter substrate-binding domain-containing protein [Chitinophagales bacterium]|nr:transporter substrate-binding domain-containing protein [Chitinophagales bacterium]